MIALKLFGPNPNQLLTSFVELCKMMQRHAAYGANFRGNHKSRVPGNVFAFQQTVPKQTECVI